MEDFNMNEIDNWLLEMQNRMMEFLSYNYKVNLQVQEQAETVVPGEEQFKQIVRQTVESVRDIPFENILSFRNFIRNEIGKDLEKLVEEKMRKMV